MEKMISWKQWQRGGISLSENQLKGGFGESRRRKRYLA